MLEGRSKVMTCPSNSSPKVVLIESKQPTAKSSLLLLLLLLLMMMLLPSMAMPAVYCSCSWFSFACFRPAFLSFYFLGLCLRAGIQWVRMAWKPHLLCGLGVQSWLIKLRDVFEKKIINFNFLIFLYYFDVLMLKII